MRLFMHISTWLRRMRKSLIFGVTVLFLANPLWLCTANAIEIGPIFPTFTELPSGGLADIINPGGPVSLNPQPLPPGALNLFTGPGEAVSLNPQPLPPGGTVVFFPEASGFTNPQPAPSGTIGVGPPTGDPLTNDGSINPGTFSIVLPGDWVSLNPQPLPPGGIVTFYKPGDWNSLNPQPLPPGGGAVAFETPGDWVSLNPQPLPPGALVGFINPIDPGEFVSLNPQPLPPGGLLSLVRLGDWIALTEPGFAAPMLDSFDGAPSPDAILVFYEVAQPVPEPASFLLVGVGLTGVGILRRRFKK